MKTLYYFDPDSKKWRTIGASNQKVALLLIRALGFLVAYEKSESVKKSDYIRRKSWLDLMGKDITR